MSIDGQSCEQLSLIPVKKMYYSISEVCRHTGLEPHVLRYWESEFPQLRPKKNRAGNRAYREKDIELVCYIKHLLYEEKYTIPGAKKKLQEGRGSEVPAEQSKTCEQAAPRPQPVLQTQLPQESGPVSQDAVSVMRGELLEILAFLRS